MQKKRAGYNKITCSLVEFCGKGGIRTLGTRKCTTVFETAPFNHSGTFPKKSEFKINTFSVIEKDNVYK